MLDRARMLHVCVIEIIAGIWRTVCSDFLLFARKWRMCATFLTGVLHLTSISTSAKDGCYLTEIRCRHDTTCMLRVTIYISNDETKSSQNSVGVSSPQQDKHCIKHQITTVLITHLILAEVPIKITWAHLKKNPTHHSLNKTWLYTYGFG